MRKPWVIRIWVLSTPHGTLGTVDVSTEGKQGRGLSTPHGTLGTHLDKLGLLPVFVNTFNSTRYIRNKRPPDQSLRIESLSTPHGTLGTVANHIRSSLQTCLSTPHGTLGTACGFRSFCPSMGLSTPHGTLGTIASLKACFWKSNFQLHTVH